MNRIFIRKEDISRIYIKTKEKNNLYKNHIINELKIFGFILIKSNNYFTVYGHPITNDKISKNHYIENNVVYRKPYITFHNKTDFSHKMYFNNEEELYTWLNENFKEYNDFLQINNK
jgi:hypothetical protein